MLGSCLQEEEEEEGEEEGGGEYIRLFSLELTTKMRQQ